MRELIGTSSEREALRGFRSLIKQKGLGPVARLDVQCPGTAAAAITVEIDAACAAKARVLLRWFDRLVVWDAVAGKYDRADPMLRLHVRGQLPASGVPVVVTALYSERSESGCTGLIRRHISQQRIRELLEQLDAVERAARTEISA